MYYARLKIAGNKNPVVSIVYKI